MKSLNVGKIISQTGLSLLAGWLYDLLRLRFKGLFLWPFLHTRANIKLYNLIYDELSVNKYEYVYVDFTQMFLPVFNVLNSKKISTDIILCVSDLYIQKFMRKNNIFTNIFLGSIASFEKFIFSKCKKVIVLNEKDAFLIKLFYDIQNVEVRPYVPPSWVKKVSRKNIQPNECIFFGNFRRKENMEALEWFVNNVFPKLLEKYPFFKLSLIGEIDLHLDFLTKFSNSIQSHGFLEDPSVIFSRSHFSIAPLKYGAGIKYKVLDSLAANVPVIGTPVAFEGIKKNRKIFLAEREEFLNVISKFLD